MHLEDIKKRREDAAKRYQQDIEDKEEEERLNPGGSPVANETSPEGEDPANVDRRAIEALRSQNLARIRVIMSEYKPKVTDSSPARGVMTEAYARFIPGPVRSPVLPLAPPPLGSSAGGGSSSGGRGEAPFQFRPYSAADAEDDRKRLAVRTAASAAAEASRYTPQQVAASREWNAGAGLRLRAEGEKVKAGFREIQGMRAEIEKLRGYQPSSLFKDARGNPFTAEDVEHAIAEDVESANPQNGRGQLRDPIASVVRERLDAEKATVKSTLNEVRRDVRERKAAENVEAARHSAEEAQRQREISRHDREDAPYAAGQAKLFDAFGGGGGGGYSGGGGGIETTLFAAVGRSGGGGYRGGGGGSGTYRVSFFNQKRERILGPVTIPGIGPDNTVAQLRSAVLDTIGPMSWNEKEFSAPILSGTPMPDENRTLRSYGVPAGAVFFSLQRVSYPRGGRRTPRKNARTTRKNR